MILEIKKADKNGNNVIERVLGGTFQFDFSPMKKQLIVWTQNGQRIYPCDRLEYSVGGKFICAFQPSTIEEEEQC